MHGYFVRCNSHPLVHCALCVALERLAAEPRRANGPSEASTEHIPAVGSSGMLASAALPLRRIATRVQHRHHDDEVSLGGEIDRVWKAFEKRPTDAAA